MKRGAILTITAAVALFLFGALAVATAGAGPLRINEDTWGLVWDPFQAISPANDDSDHPDVAVGGDMIVQVTWEGWHGDAFGVWSSEHPPAGAWSTPANVSQMGVEDFPEFARIAVDGNNAAHVVFDNVQMAILYGAKPAGGSWSAPVQLSPADSQQLVFQPVIALNPANNGRYVAWAQGVEYTEQNPSQSAIDFTWQSAVSSTWTTPTHISGETRDAMDPDIVVDSSGALHVVWSALLTGDTAQIFYRRRDAAGNWGAVTQIATCAGNCEAPSVSVDNLFQLAVVAWAEETVDGKEIFFSSQYSDGLWSPAANISNTPAISRSPDTLVMADGRILVVWVDSQAGDEGLYYAHRQRFSETWSSPIAIVVPGAERNISYPHWILDDTGGTHLVWSTWKDGEHVTVWYAHGVAGAAPPTATPTMTPGGPTATPTSTPALLRAWLPLILRQH